MAPVINVSSIRPDAHLLVPRAMPVVETPHVIIRPFDFPRVGASVSYSTAPKPHMLEKRGVLSTCKNMQRGRLPPLSRTMVSQSRASGVSMQRVKQPAAFRPARRDGSAADSVVVDAGKKEKEAEADKQRRREQRRLEVAALEEVLLEEEQSQKEASEVIANMRLRQRELLSRLTLSEFETMKKMAAADSTDTRFNIDWAELMRELRGPLQPDPTPVSAEDPLCAPHSHTKGGAEQFSPSCTHANISILPYFSSGCYDDQYRGRRVFRTEKVGNILGAYSNVSSSAPASKCHEAEVATSVGE